jgi:AcrR family transcriptional regulator
MGRKGPERLDGRRERSRRTRARIIDAAASLFIERGYVATTIEEVADRAGVAVQTVYYVFSTKTNLLSAVLDSSIGGDAEAVPIVEQEWVDSLRATAETTAAVRALIAASATILSRTTEIYEVVRRAAADPVVARLLDDTRRRRRQDQRHLIDVLAHSGHLDAGVDVGLAADALYAVVNEEVFQLLTRDCGWDTEQFVAWATSVMVHELMDTSGSTRSTPTARPKPRRRTASR